MFCYSNRYLLKFDRISNSLKKEFENWSVVCTTGINRIAFDLSFFTLPQLL